MRFLVDASLPRSATALLRQLGMTQRTCATSDCAKPRTMSSPPTLGLTSSRLSRAISISLTSATIPPADYAGIVVLQVPDNATAPQVVKLLETFVRREDWLAKLRRRLAIVEVWRVRFRPA